MGKYSVSQWIFGREPLEISLERLSRCGYDAVELGGEPGKTDVKKLRNMLRERGLGVSSICGFYPPDRDLTHNDRSIRNKAVRYVKECANFAAETGGPLVIVVPSPIGKPKATLPLAEELKLAAEGIREAGEHAQALGVTLAIEALNRFETYLVNKLEQAVGLARQVGLPNVGIMADAFHMNIEESSLADSVRKAGEMVRHVHIADSNRESPGRGHTDFPAFVHALKEIHYPGWYTMEFLPPTSNPYLAAEHDSDQAAFDTLSMESISRMKALVEG